MYIRHRKNYRLSKPKLIVLIITVFLFAFLINAFINYIDTKLIRHNLVSTINNEINIISKDSSKSKNSKSNSARLAQLNKVKDTLLNKSTDDSTASLLSDLASSSNEIQKLVAFGYKYIGYPYVFGANGPDSFDCSSFVQHVFSQFNVDLPRVTYDQVTVGKKVKSNNLKPGDIVFTDGTAKKPEHVGIYIGGGQMIHASKSNSSIIISPVYNFITARRVI